MQTSARYGQGVYGNSSYGLIFLDGTLSLSFVSKGRLSGKTALVSTISHFYTVQAAGRRFRSGSSSISFPFSLQSLVKGIGRVNSELNTEFLGYATLKAIGSIESQSQVVNTISGVAKGAGRVSSKLSTNFFIQSTLKGAGKLSGFSQFGLYTGIVISISPYALSLAGDKSITNISSGQYKVIYNSTNQSGELSVASTSTNSATIYKSTNTNSNSIYEKTEGY